MGLSVVPSSPDGAAHGTEDPEDSTDDDQHDADRVEDADVEQQPQDEQDQSEQDHALPPSRSLTCSYSPRTGALTLGRPGEPGARRAPAPRSRARRGARVVLE